MRETIAVLLAGGVGSRLSILVSLRAKPAVPFGGIYRIIDFTMSNISNSGLTRVAVLTQYKPLSLMDHIGDGSSWDLSGRTLGVRILPPKTGEKDWDWYKGTADAVRQNLEFVSRGDYRNVLILSGDHVYYMDYSRLVGFHRDCGAKVTIGMLSVPWEETHNFGIGVIDREHRIVDWEEKPAKARSNLASMGVYVFDRDYLVAALNETKESDFGHHIIPTAMKKGDVFAYPFNGYWRDVGTIDAYWEANMDLVRPETEFRPEAWQTRTNLAAEGLSYDRPPIKVNFGARVSNSVISPGCVISGLVQNSVLSPGVVVERGARVCDSVIMHDAFIAEGAQVERSILDKKVSIGSGTIIGRGNRIVANREQPTHLYAGLTVIGKSASVPQDVCIGTNCIIHAGVTGTDFPGAVVADGETVVKTG
jgi:glucose-1-phosphate adenylyltransferase